MDELDELYMRRALELAACGEAEGEVPVGVVLVHEGRVIAETWNRPISLRDPTAHAEILALRAGGEALGNYRLPGATLYVTLEPCAMCAGAMVHARVARLVYGAADPRAGAVDSNIGLLRVPGLNHRVAVRGGVLGPECSVARLAAPVPKPRVHLTRFHGVFAPNSRYRARITPARRGRGSQPRTDREEPPTPAERRAAMTWAQRLKRGFGIDIHTCAACGGAVRIIACIEDPQVIEKILAHVDKKTTDSPGWPPPCRAPPQRGLFDSLHSPG